MTRPERLFYRLAGVDAGTEQTSPVYLRSVLAFSAAVGVVVALIRGIGRTRTDRLGNFLVDLARTSFRVLLPLASVAAVVMVASGGANSAHSFENPSVLISLFQVFLILLIPRHCPTPLAGWWATGSRAPGATPRVP